MKGNLDSTLTGDTSRSGHKPGPSFESNGKTQSGPSPTQNGYAGSSAAEPELDGNEADPIAICGFSIKFPQDATSPEAFWRMLMERRCAMSKMPSNRLNPKGFHRKGNRLNTLPLQGGHFIKDDLSVFDAEFFSIPSAEAAAMDPMQRWLLETAYRALESAGIPMEQVSGSPTAVYTGSFSTDYMMQLLRDAEAPPMYAAVGLGLSMLANRLSWFFNLHGPSVGLDSACSSTAMAIDLACQSLRNGGCGMSMVAGCNLTFSPEYFTWLSNLNFLSPDSRCYSFDHRANGYARGEGIGVIILKRLSAAIRDGNTIRAVIRATGSNEDGRTPGITQPSSQAQERLIRETYQRAGLSMAHTRYFEAHGTGTPLGDPLEARAIGSAFQEYRSNSDPIYVGAAKSNLGHLEGASGVAGLIKAILVLEKGVIPPNANFEKLNPKIDAESLNLKFPKDSHVWPTPGLRRASVNSFGYGGANSHIILDDAYNYLRLRRLSANHCTEPRPPPTASSSILTKDWHQVEIIPCHENGHLPKLLVWSAADKDGLGRIVDAYEDHGPGSIPSASSYEYFLDNMAYTLDARRTHHSWRSFAVLDSPVELQSLRSRLSSPTQARSAPPHVGYVFTGQGAQWFAMGRELMAYPSFSADMDCADTYLKSLGCGWSVTDELSKPKETSQIDSTEMSQTLCTVLQLAIVNLLGVFGLQPSAVVGHSSGEIAAAYAGSYISFESALKLAYFRGVCSAEISRSPKTQSQGAMMAVGSSPNELKDLLATLNQGATTFGLSIACINSPSTVTVSGEEHLIEQLKTRLDERQVFARKLRVTVAYHSRQMSQISAKYASMIGSLLKREGSRQVPMMSSVTGTHIPGAVLTKPSYWVSNMESPVRFSQAILAMCAQSEANGSHKSNHVVEHLMEIGPHAALQGPIRETLAASPRGKTIGYTAVLKRAQSAMTTTLTAMGQLHAMGCKLNLRAINEPAGGEKVVRSLLVNLPEYPFDHSRGYWYESRLSKNYRLREHAPSEFLGARSGDWSSSEARWRHFIRTAELPWVEDHVINGTTLYPAGGMVVMAIEAAKQLAEQSHVIDGYNLRDIRFENPINLTASGGTVEVQTLLREVPGTDQMTPVYEFVIRSVHTEGGDWVLNCRGFISAELSEPSNDWGREQAKIQRQNLPELYPGLLSDCGKPVEPRHMYDFLQQECGFEYGQHFRVAQHQHCDDDRRHATAEVTLSESARDEHVIHPVSLDAIFHLSFTALSSGGSKPIATSVPTRVSYLWVSNKGLNWPGEDNAKICTAITQTTRRGFTCNGIALGRGGSKDVRLWYDGLEMTNVTATPRPTSTLPNPQQFCMNVDCKVALDKLEPTDVCTLLDQLHPGDEDLSELSRDLELLVEVSLGRLADSVDPGSINKRHPWRAHYWNWVQYHLAESRRRRRWDDPDSHIQKASQSFDELCDRIGNINHIGRLYVAVASNVVGLFNGDINPLELLIHTGLLKNCYEELVSHRSSMQIISYVDLLAHQAPGSNILEIGGGTGSGTRNMIRGLRTRPGDPDGLLRCNRYDFTDVSPAFFDEARKEFANFGSQMNFKTLDIERDFGDQGFLDGDYDVVLAVSVLHISSNLAGTVQRIRKAMKPGGKLIMHESFDASGWTLGFVSGFLTGWWLGVEDGRILSPSISLEQWNNILKENGFSGVDIVRDFGREKGFHYGWIISTAVEEKSPDIPQTRQPFQITLVADKAVPEQQAVAQDLSVPLRSMFGAEVIIRNFEMDISSHKGRADELTILLAEYGPQYLRSIDATRWECLKSVVQASRRLLWVSSGGGQNAEPGYGMLEGLARTLRVEHYELHLVTLALEGTASSNRTLSHLTRIVQEMMARLPHEHYEQEYIELDGLLCTRRLVEARYLKSAIDARVTPYKAVSTTLESGVQFTLSTASPGLSDGPHYVQTPPFSTAQPETDHVDINLKAVLLQGRSHASDPAHDSQTVGIYCSGIVLDADSCDDFRAGDHVFAVGVPSIRSHVRLPSQALTKIPSDLSLTESCWALPTLAVVHKALIEAGRTQLGDAVLVHGGATSTGLAALQLLAKLGVADVWTTADDERESTWITENVDIPERRILPKTWFDHLSLPASQLRQRFDVVLCADEATAAVLFMSCMKPGGRYVMLRTGFASPKHHFPQMIHAVPTDVSLCTIDLTETHLSQESIHYAAANSDILTTKTLSDQAILFPASSLASAFDHVRSSDDQKPAVLTFDEADVIQLMASPQSAYGLSPEATYLIAGGLGGLGRAMAEWLVSRGARYLILLSRGGPRTQEASDLLLEFEKQNVHVEAPPCDVSEVAALRSVLSSCASRMPPIKGCIQASMVMTESLFERMAFQDWKAAVNPKVQGSWNLHAELPRGLDFFVLFSSGMGIIGTASLAAYNSGNTYQDALARYRVAQGERAVALDLGGVVDGGYIAENTRYSTFFQRNKQLAPLYVQEVLALLDVYCDPDSALSQDAGSCQSIIGISQPAAWADEDPPFTMKQPFWGHMHHLPLLSGHEQNADATADTTRQKQALNPAARLAATESAAEAAEVVSEALVQRISALVGTSEDRIDPQKPMQSYGIDSLSALDLRNWVSKVFDVDMPVFEILGGATFESAGMSIAGKVRAKA